MGDFGRQVTHGTFAADQLAGAFLDLPFKVEISVAAASTVAELDTRVAAKEPVLMYWWTPTAAVSKYDLVNVKLPAYNEQCAAHQAAKDGAVDCDYPEDVLQKYASAKLEEKAPEVYAFLQKFTMTNDDQLGLLPSAEIDKKPVDEVAKGWLDENADVWKAWLG